MMGGLLKRNAAEWEHIKALESQVATLTETIAGLEREVASMRGRLRSVENVGAAANSRCERFETRIGKLEYQARLPDVVERTFAPGAEDADPPLKQKTCSTCRGAGEVFQQYGDEAARCDLCTSCDGRGHVDVAP
jgi:DnaJ-class molecular chaperone